MYMEDSCTYYILVSLTAAWDLQNSKKQPESINDLSCFKVLNDTSGECAAPRLSSNYVL